MKKYFFVLFISLFVFGNLLADEPFRKHRFDTFKVLPMNENSIVFVGNSITDMHCWAEAFGNDSRIINRGNSGALSSEILANAESYIHGKPAKVFLMIGTNDFNTSTDKEIIDNIEETIKYMQRRSPRTEIYIESILPSTNNRNLARITGANEAIQRMLAKYPSVTYIDLYTKLIGKIDNPNSNDYSCDKLHLTAAAYQIWCETIKQYLGKDIQISYPQNTLQLQTYAQNTGSHGMRSTYFSVLPVNPNDILFFGDEMVKNGEWQELLGNPNIKNRGTGWGYEGTSGDIIPVVNANVNATFSHNKVSPRRILVYTGTNTVNSGEIEKAKREYKELIQNIKTKAPKTRIFVLSLMPTNMNACNEHIKEFNSWLKDFAKETDNVSFININTPLSNSHGNINPIYFNNYNNYLTGMGYIKVAEILSKYIENCHPISENEARKLHSNNSKRY